MGPGHADARAYHCAAGTAFTIPQSAAPTAPVCGTQFCLLAYARTKLTAPPRNTRFFCHRQRSCVLPFTQGSHTLSVKPCGFASSPKGRALDGRIWNPPLRPLGQRELWNRNKRRSREGDSFTAFVCVQIMPVGTWQRISDPDRSGYRWGRGSAWRPFQTAPAVVRPLACLAGGTEPECTGCGERWGRFS